MATETRTLTKDINLELLQQELRAALGSVMQLVDPVGYERVTERQMTPRAADFVYSRSVVGGVVTELTAVPGQIIFTVSAPLTGPQNTTLDNALTAHVHTGKSTDQTNRDAAEAELAAIEAKLDAATPLNAADTERLARSTIALERQEA